MRLENDALTASGNDDMPPIRLRSILFRLARLAGLFALSRWLYRNHQLILCYHAFSYQDEHLFRPQQYMQPTRFAARIELMCRRGYRVISLSEAVTRLQRHEARLRDVVITIDDGFTSAYRFALPELSKRNMPATLYLTTYYVTCERPVFNLALQYILWKSGLDSVELDLRMWGWPARRQVSLHGPNASEAIDALITEALHRLDEDQRERFLGYVAESVGVPLVPQTSDRRFHLITPAMAQALVAGRIELQLHTHRHRYPEDPPLLRREIEDNREVLRALGAPAATHLCYPSGKWRKDAFAMLQECGIESATTCLPGLNSVKTHPLALHRILDANDIDEVEFDAEISGFKHLLRCLQAQLSRLA